MLWNCTQSGMCANIYQMFRFLTTTKSHQTLCFSIVLRFHILFFTFCLKQTVVFGRGCFGRFSFHPPAYGKGMFVLEKRHWCSKPEKCLSPVRFIFFLIFELFSKFHIELPASLTNALFPKMWFVGAEAYQLSDKIGNVMPRNTKN